MVTVTVIDRSTNPNEYHDYDLSVNGVPGNDPRVDELGEEIGRVGAQGAALAALKLSNTIHGTNSNHGWLW